MANEVQNLVVNGTTYPIGGGGLLVTITLTTSGSTDTYTADKTAQEIYDALEAGTQPVIKYGAYYYPLTYIKTNGSSYLQLRCTSVINHTLEATSMSAYPSYSGGGGSGA